MREVTSQIPLCHLSSLLLSLRTAVTCPAFETPGISMILFQRRAVGSCRGKPGPQEPSHVGPECQEFRPFISYLLGGRTPHPNPEAAPSLSFPSGVWVLGSAHVVIARPDPGQRTSTITLPWRRDCPRCGVPGYLAFASFFSLKKEEYVTSNKLLIFHHPRRLKNSFNQEARLKSFCKLFFFFKLER